MSGGLAGTALLAICVLGYNIFIMNTSTTVDSKYNAQLEALDSLFEFHKDAFAVLLPEARADLEKYFRTGISTPGDIFAYRREVAHLDPTLAARATKAADIVCKSLGIVGFQDL